MTQTALEDFDQQWPDDDEHQTLTRRLFTYSSQALAVAAPVDRIMVSHPGFKEALTACDRVFQLSRELSIPQGLVISGSTGAGKTALIRYFQASLPKSSLFEDGHGAVAVRLSKKPVLGQIIGRLLGQLRYPFPDVNTNTIGIKKNVLIDALRQKGTRLIFVDEAHHLLTQTKMRTRVNDGNKVTDLLRELMDEVPLGIALCGSPELQELENIDSHLFSRISARYVLKPFEQGLVWQGFVQAFARQSKGFDLQFLVEKNEALRLHSATQGNLRAFKRLVTEAVLVCADEGQSRLESKHLQMAFGRANGKSSSIANPYGGI